MVTAKDIAELRARTGSGMMDCKKALEEANGDAEKAIDVLRKKGMAKAAKKADREANEGIIESYIHSNGKIGVLVEVLSETDFVAKNEEFKAFAHDIALHIAAMNPKYLRPSDVDVDELAKEKAIYLEEVSASGKPAEIAEKIVEGKIKKFSEENALMCQAFVKDPSKTIEELLNEKIAKIGEKLEIKRFARFEIGN
ncbi:MAG: translation elongation factor Ts [bacterium]